MVIYNYISIIVENIGTSSTLYPIIFMLNGFSSPLILYFCISLLFLYEYNV